MTLLETLAREFRVEDGTPLAPLRERAFANARRRGLPTTREEDWKYTDVAGLTLAVPARAAAPSSGQPALPFVADGLPRLVFVDGRYQPALSAVPPEAGVTARALSAVLADEPMTLAPLFERCAADDAPVFDALNAAFVEDGALIEIAAGVALARPLIVLFAHSGAAARHTAPQLVVRAGARSSLEIVEVHYGRDTAANLTNALTDIDAAASSRVTHYRLTAEAAAAAHLGSVRLRAARDATLTSYSFAFGGRLTRVDVHATLAEPGARVVLNGLFVASAGQHVDHQTFIDHQAAHTTSEELYKGLAAGDGRGVFRGKVLVREGAQKISAQQASHNLLLSPTAEIDTKPELEIYADDVACAHGATVGQIDDAAVFYLQSRGIPAAEARALLTFGFAQAVVEQVDFAPLRAWLTAALAGRADVPLPTPVEEDT